MTNPLSMVSEKAAPEGRIAIAALTGEGVRLARRLASELPESVLFAPWRHASEGAVPFDRLGDFLGGNWGRFQAHVFIMAAGIVVRHIAPLIAHKAIDPAVVVMDEKGRYAVSLLSGHLGGANDLARKLARITGGQAVITTASDVRSVPALDLIAQSAGLEIENIAALSRVALALLEETIWLVDPLGLVGPYLAGSPNVRTVPWEAVFPRGSCIDNTEALSPDPVVIHGSSHYRMGSESTVAHPEDSNRQGPRGPFKAPGETPEFEPAQGNVLSADGQPPTPVELPGEPDVWKLLNGPGVWVSEYLPPSGVECLVLRPRNLVVGIGCNRGTPTGEILGFLRDVFRRERLAPLSIRNLASVDLKSDEAGLLAAAASLGRPVHFFSRQELDRIEVLNPSATVQKHIGIESVCEAAALLSARGTALLVPKQKTPNVTLAIARVDSLS